MIVVKLGGAEGNDLAPALAEVASQPECVLVHGGSAEVDRLGSALGRPARYLTSPSGVISRYTDPPGLELLTMALAGKVNTGIVAHLQGLGIRALGLSGVDGALVVGQRKEGTRAVEQGRIIHVKDDYAASIQAVNVDLLQLLVRAGYVPVVSPPAITPSGEVVNVDADRLAARLAIAVHARALVLLTNVPGLLEDPENSDAVIPLVTEARFASYLEIAHGRMKKKLLAAEEAARNGVARVVIGSSRGAQPIARALAGRGTVIS
ncbi:MAG: [LysW]-aminoadipate kinase [Thermoplasmata archaeon]